MHIYINSLLIRFQGVLRVLNRTILIIIKYMSENPIKYAIIVVGKNKMYNSDALKIFVRQKRQEDALRRQSEAFNNLHYSSPFRKLNYSNHNVYHLPANDFCLQDIEKLNIDIVSKVKISSDVSYLNSTLNNMQTNYGFLYSLNSKDAENWLQEKYLCYSPDESCKFLSIIANEAIKQLIAHFIKKQLTQAEAADFDTCLNIFETFNSVGTMLSQNKDRLDKCAAIAKLVQITTKYLK